MAASRNGDSDGTSADYYDSTSARDESSAQTNGSWTSCSDDVDMDAHGGSTGGSGSAGDGDNMCSGSGMDNNGEDGAVKWGNNGADARTSTGAGTDVMRMGRSGATFGIGGAAGGRQPGPADRSSADDPAAGNKSAQGAPSTGDESFAPEGRGVRSPARCCAVACGAAGSGTGGAGAHRDGSGFARVPQPHVHSIACGAGARRRRREAPRTTEGKFTSPLSSSRTLPHVLFPLVEEWAPPDCTSGEENDGTNNEDGSAVKWKRWLIRSPVTRARGGLATFSKVSIFRAPPAMPSWEVYVRAVAWSHRRLGFDQKTAAYDSIKILYASMLAGSCELLSNSAEPWSSWRGVHVGARMTRSVVKGVMEKATRASKKCGGRLLRGAVLFHKNLPIDSDPWHQKCSKASAHKHRRSGARCYSGKAAVIGRGRAGSMLKVLTSRQLADARRMAELDVDSPPVGRKGESTGRRRRVTVAYGLSAPRSWPRKEQLSACRKALLDDDAHARHSFVTEAADGSLDVWDYIPYSATTGPRRYTNGAGVTKQLRTPWGASNGMPAWKGDIPKDNSFAVFDEDAGAASSPTDDDGDSGGEADWEDSDDEVHTEESHGRARVALDELMCGASSLLVNEDGSDEILVRAVVLDAAFSLQRALDIGVKANLPEQEARDAPRAVLTLGADGGPMRGQSVVAVTVALSTPVLAAGRTNLLPLAYVFGGEKSVSATIYRFIGSVVRALMSTNLTVDVEPDLDGVDDTVNLSIELTMDDVLHVAGMFFTKASANMSAAPEGLPCWWRVMGVLQLESFSVHVVRVSHS